MKSENGPFKVQKIDNLSANRKKKKACTVPGNEEDNEQNISFVFINLFWFSFVGKKKFIRFTQSSVDQTDICLSPLIMIF